MALEADAGDMAAEALIRADEYHIRQTSKLYTIGAVASGCV
jgi:hypothetical protein